MPREEVLWRNVQQKEMMRTGRPPAGKRERETANPEEKLFGKSSGERVRAPLEV